MTISHSSCDLALDSRGGHTEVPRPVLLDNGPPSVDLENTLRCEWIFAECDSGGVFLSQKPLPKREHPSSKELAHVSPR
jgi:hypothetical protein